MAYIECDTKKLYSCGEDILTLTEDFKDIIEDLYIRLNNINKNENCWQGIDADKYVESVLKDKEVYTDFYNQLVKYGQLMKETAIKFDDTIKKDKYKNE